jgi:putative transposase
MHKAIKCVVPANNAKYQQVKSLLHPFRETLSALIVKMDRILLSGEQVSPFSPYKPEDLDSSLSARQVQTAYAQAKGSFDSWTTWLQNEVRSLITNSSLEEHTKIVLYRINVRKEWHKKYIELSWCEKDNVLIPCSPKTKNSKLIAVDNEHLILIRAIVKRAKKKRSRPNLLKVNTLVMDAKVAKLEVGSNSFPYWLKLSTLTKGKPVLLPLKSNPFMETEKQKGKILNFVQVSILESVITVSPIIEIPDADDRIDGEIIGIDWGVTSLFATSDGQLLGTRMLTILKEWDKILMDLQADLQRRGIPLKNNAKYQAMQKRINSLVKNEVGRLLNKLAKPDLQKIIVEKLDFRFGGLSKSINRIITRAGRKAVEAKLSRLYEEKGITIQHVNAAYTSQECSSCGYINKKNRKTQSLFICLCCGNKKQADINAALNIRERRSLPVTINKINTSKTRRNLRDVLQDVHALKCPSGKHLATAKNIGFVGTASAV